MGRALALAANAVNINVITNEMSDIGCDGFVGKCGEADLAAAVGHVNGLIDGLFRSRRIR